MKAIIRTHDIESAASINLRAEADRLVSAIACVAGEFGGYRRHSPSCRAASEEPGHVSIALVQWQGISWSSYKMLQSRILSYVDAYRYRLGTHYEAVPVADTLTLLGDLKRRQQGSRML